MSLAMSEHERQEFLAGVHVGVISIERADGPPLTVPIWYGYEPGGLV
jgi:nitroimidazol reductase NimA-like FMN-containing flavoprotein (pyridoxamine 5'-phosphate oxidase superfamily)